MSYNRLYALCRDIGLPSPRTLSAPSFITFLLQRLLAKSERLAREIDGLSPGGARDVVAAACNSINWERLVRAYSAILSPENLHDEAWDLVGSLGAVIEPADTSVPLCTAQRVLVAKFANGLQFALQTGPPDAYNLTARLYGYKDWAAATGPMPLVFPDIPFYRYRERENEGRTLGLLEPTAAALRIEEETEAETLGLDADARADIAMQCMASRVDMLAAGAIACTAALEAGRLDQVVFCGWRSIEAIRELLPEKPAPLSNGPRSNRYWREILSAWIIAVRKLGNAAEITERQLYDVNELLSAFEPIEAAWESGTDITPTVRRTMFRVVSP